jgi:hypothetical protein
MASGMNNMFFKRRVSIRWGQILKDKDVDQGPFGICGMAASLHSLLLQRPQRASELAAATFWDLWQEQAVIPGHPGMKEFPTAKCGAHHIDLPYLLRRHAQMWHHPPPNAPAPVPEYFTDFCVSRALGYLLKVTRPDRYDSEKCDFNQFFGEHQTVAGRKKITRAGTLALRTDTVAFILRDLLGAQVEIAHNNVDLHRTRQFWLGDVERKRTRNPQQLMDGISRELRERKFVIAAIDVHLISAGIAAHPEGLPYNHWVVIEGANRTAGGNNLKIWSWGETHDYQRITDDEIMDAIYDLIVGRFRFSASAALAA